MFKHCLLFLISMCCSAACAQSDGIDKILADRGFATPPAQMTSSKTPDAQIVLSAMGYVGLPYKRGGTSFEAGFDCSGFVKSLFQETIGKFLPRTSAEQAQQTTQINQDELQPGDLVFFNTLKRAFSHVGIYIGNGRFVHSPRSGAQVRIEDMNTRYWVTRFNGARRVE